MLGCFCGVVYFDAGCLGVGDLSSSSSSSSFFLSPLFSCFLFLAYICACFFKWVQFGGRLGRYGRGGVCDSHFSALLLFCFDHLRLRLRRVLLCPDFVFILTRRCGGGREGGREGRKGDSCSAGASPLLLTTTATYLLFPSVFFCF